MNDDKLYLIHISECIERILEYTAGGQEIFMADHKTQDAVLRNLQTLAESTQRLSADLKSSHGDVPWQDIAGFRDVLVHQYLGVNLIRVWEIIDHHLPTLAKRINPLLENQPKSPPNS